MDEFPLHRAAAICDLERMKYLLDQGIPIDSRDCRQNTPLHYASTKEAAEFLINNKCDLDARNCEGETALMRMPAKDIYDLNYFEFLRVKLLLIDSGADVNCCDINNWNALHFACYSCYYLSYDFGVMRLLVSKVSDINAITTGGGSKTSGGDSALSLAAFKGNKDVVNLLIQSGAHISCGLTFSHNLFHIAASKGWADIVEATINEFDVNSTTSTRQQSALMMAASERRYAVVDLLLKFGADIYLKDYNNDTALSFALPDYELFILMVNKGAYLEDSDYRVIRFDTRCRERILNNVDLCTQLMINEYDNMCLPTVYQMYSSVRKLPLIDSLKIKNNQSVITEIKTSVSREIQMKTFCNVKEVRPLVLQMLAVRSLISDDFAE